MLAFTICAKNYLAKAIVLRESFLEHNPKDNFLIVVADAIGSREELKLLSEVLPEGTIFFHELRNKLYFPRLEELLVKYDVTEFCTAIKPFVFQYLFASQKDDVVLYLDPDMVVYDTFGVLKNFLQKHNIVLTPHCLRPKPKAEDDSTFLASGAYNLGFLALRNSEASAELLSWWGERLLDHCYKEPRPYFTDQKWIDLVPSMFEGVGILKHAGYNVARWNLSERKLAPKDDDKWYVNEQYPLVCYHYSQDRKNLTTSGPLGLLADYNNKLLKARNTELSPLAYYYDSVPGTDISITTWRKRQQAGYATTADFQILRPCSDYQTVFTGKMPTDSFGLNLVGYFRSPNGTGQAARDFARSLLSTGIPFAITALEGGPEQMGELEYYCTGNPVYESTIFFVNADQLPSVMEKYPHLRRKTNVAVFWWELDGWFPFKESFGLVDHVVTFSHFVQNALTGSVPDKVKLHYLSYPFRPLEPYRDYFYPNGCEFRRQMGVSLEDFLFGFSFDFNSCEERKNPLGLIEAFSNAFTPDDSVFLLLKMTNGTEEQVANLGAIASRSIMRERIRFITQNLSRYDHLSLMSGLDCYVSLHRSEGLGLGLMEAMAMGKPVIATAYGGNLDFMNSRNSYLVNYRKTEVQKDFKNYYPAGATWAEPDIYHAIEQMRLVYRSKADVLGKGLEARHTLKRRNATAFRQEIYSLLNSF